MPCPLGRVGISAIWVNCVQVWPCTPRVYSGDSFELAVVLAPNGYNKKPLKMIADSLTVPAFLKACEV
ncbi:hypothetical protein BDN71DRAFT_1442884 [Pleurotus eryngii]|uniref:Uncharacterized protein n=1 Tax=Pleurotus eryngii TaxID=5323 RepID=A0A9P6A4I6_PLEER|nr:hypothetical protein BDN71DRAFT_1442884 [Pleurotus eryngii]